MTQGILKLENAIDYLSTIPMSDEDREASLALLNSLHEVLCEDDIDYIDYMTASSTDLLRKHMTPEAGRLVRFRASMYLWKIDATQESGYCKDAGDLAAIQLLDSIDDAESAHPGYQHNYKNGRCAMKGCKATI